MGIEISVGIFIFVMLFVIITNAIVLKDNDKLFYYLCCVYGLVWGYLLFVKFSDLVFDAVIVINALIVILYLYKQRINKQKIFENVKYYEKQSRLKALNNVKKFLDNYNDIYGTLTINNNYLRVVIDNKKDIKIYEKNNSSSNGSLFIYNSQNGDSNNKIFNDLCEYFDIATKYSDIVAFLNNKKIQFEETNLHIENIEIQPIKTIEARILNDDVNVDL